MDWLPVVLNGAFLIVSLAATLLKYLRWEVEPTPDESTEDDVSGNDEEEKDEKDSDVIGSPAASPTVLAGLQALPFLYSALRFLVFRKDP